MLPGWYGFGTAVRGLARARTPTTAWRSCRRCTRDWPFFRTLLSNMDMVLAKTDIAIASRYAELVGDEALRDAIFERLRAEWQTLDRCAARDHAPAGRCWRTIRCSRARSATASPTSTR